jgi:integrase/recombinase XerD
VKWETVQDILAVQSPRVQKNTTPALTEQQAIRLLHAPDTSTLTGLRDRAILHSLFISACRVSAICNACVGHLEFDGTDHFLHVTEKRGRKQRKILLEAARSIQAYLHATGIGEDMEGPLFRPVGKDGKTLLRQPMHRGSVWRIVKKYCVRAGISPDRLGGRGIGVHSLRKTGLNNAIQNGAQLHEVRELAGHSDIRTTELYFVRKEEDAERAARRIQIH